MCDVLRVAFSLVLAVVGVLALQGPAAGQGAPVGGSGSEFFLNDEFTGSANIVFSYGDPRDVVYFGDWDGDSIDTPLIQRGTVFHVRNSNSSGVADFTFTYGNPGDVVLVGDWDGDGVDTLGVRRGATYYLRNSLSTGLADVVLSYGEPSDVVLVGDWDGDGDDTLAVRRETTFFVKDSISSGVADYTFVYGNPGDLVLVGDWDGDGDDTLAVRRVITYYLRNSTTSGVADVVFAYGNATDTAFTGDWNADRADTIGIRRPAENPPFFVYGSLRTGQVGFYLLDGRTTQQYLTRMPWLDLYRSLTSSFPYAVPNGSNTTGIVGEVMHVVPDLYASVLRSLDTYERYDPRLPPDNQIYIRELRQTREGVQSWVYVAGPRQADYLRSNGILITSGDWLLW